MMKKAIDLICEYFDTALVLTLAAVCAVLGYQNKISPNILASATLATLTALGVVLIRDRAARERVRIQISGVERRMSELIGGIHSMHADALFNHPTLEEEEKKLLREAEDEAWIVQETGAKIAEGTKTSLTNLLRRDGAIRMIVAAPSDFTVRLMAFRNANLNSDGMANRAHTFNDHVIDITNQVAERAEKLQVRFVPYPMEFTCIMGDPLSPVRERSRAVVRYAGFRVPYDDKIDFALSASTSPKAFSYYVRQVELMFIHSYKVVLLAGPPRSGKTTMMDKLRDRYQQNSEVYFAISRAIGDREDRRGFELITTHKHESPVTWAERKGDGYEVNQAALNTLADELKAAHQSGKVIVLDEIGPLQTQNSAFSEVVKEIISDPSATLFASVQLVSEKDDLMSWAKRHYRSTVIHMGNEQEQSAVLKQLQAELDASLRVRSLAK
jgi:nucleoside-triphosphatase THEP1